MSKSFSSNKETIYASKNSMIIKFYYFSKKLDADKFYLYIYNIQTRLMLISFIIISKLYKKWKKLLWTRYDC